MKKVLKKISSVLCLFILMLSSISTLMTNAHNTSDINWYSNCDFCVAKRDNTPIYIKNMSNYCCTIYIYGETTANGNQKKDVSYYDNKKLVTENITIPAKSERQIHQFVYELNYPYIHIYFKGNAYGVWNPDGIVTYPLSN